MKRISGIGYLYLFYFLLPFVGAYNTAASNYRYVNGSVQKVPFSIENGAIGFVAGLIIAVVLFGLTVAARAAIRRIRRGWNSS